jgi:pentatricopeptide repeat protein
VALVRRRWASTSLAAPPTDVTGDPTYKNFFDLLTMPSRSAAWVERERLMAQPHTFEAFFGKGEKVTSSRLAALLQVQVVKGEAQGAVDTLERLRGLPGASVGWVQINSALAAVARAGDAATFEKLWRDAEARGMGRGDVYTFSSAAKCFMNSGDTERALAMAQEAKEAGVMPNEVLYGALLSGYAQRGDFEGATAVWDFLRTSSDAPRPDSVLYTAMIHACGKAGKAEKALQLLDEMKEEGLVPTEVTYNAALYAAAKRRDKWQDAKDLFAAMLGAGMEPTEYTLNTLLLCAARAGDVESCRRVVLDLSRTRGAAVSRLSLNTQLTGYAAGLRQCTPAERTALLADAEKVYERIEREFGADQVSRVARLQVHCSGHFVARAQRLFEELGEAPPLQAHTLMVKMWAETGRPQQLQAAWTRFRAQVGKPDSLAYRWAIEGFARAYWVKTALKLLREMVEEGGMVPQRRHTRILLQRCGQEDMRRERAEVMALIERANGGQELRLKKERNDAALMIQKLAGDGVKPFLLPFPLAPLKEKHTEKHT